MANNQTESDKLSAHVAEEIRVWMTRRRMSGERLARELDRSSAWVSYRINGQVDLKLGELEKIAAALEVEVATLLPAPARRENIGGSSPMPELVSSSVGRTDDPRPIHAHRGTAGRFRTRRPVWTHAGVTG